LSNIKGKQAGRLCDPQTRIQQGRRFKAMYTRMGYTAADVAKYLHVSERTVHNWVTGSVRVPYASYKLLRVHLRYELPGEHWQGWHISAGKLWTPEGYSLDPHDFTWWSLFVRRAALFGTLYRQNNQLRANMSRMGRKQARDALAPVPADGPSGPACHGHGRQDGEAGLDLSLQHFGTSGPKNEVSCGFPRGAKKTRFVTKRGKLR
jgi:hypothetical protein